jgi:hypothetical protein
LSNIVFGNSAPPETGRDDGEKLGRPVSVVLQVVREVGVERDAVARPEPVTLAVDQERGVPVQDDGGLATSGLVDRRIVRPAGGRAGIEPVPGDIRALARKGRGQLLDSVAPTPMLAAFTPTHDNHVTGLVEAQELGQRQLEAGGDPRRDREGRTGLTAFDLGEHGGADAAALGKVAK